ncbi:MULTISPECIES: hypothetical protein [Streptomyces]|uniref:ABM domain-containing protein n=1 Tax=Streptomyces morookaense TaxID=1970 RepID=A0A7Y7E8G2_STRMO|nr:MULTISPECIES: hypothetical protein [Streptomyces]MCC2280195.1 hypothetical protein [Streptomyces sp. ET3-23]NVK80010.1 hypothetical protein [Streptomyces morookaense]
MAIIVTFDMEDTAAAQELYDTCIDRLTEGRGFASPADLPVPGLLAHIAGPVGGRWRVTDVWESPESFEAFGKILGPIIADLGYEGLRPDVSPAHRVVLR